MSESNLDLELLDDYLGSHVEGFGRLRNVSKFSGGQSNPTFLLETTSAKYVLRRQPSGELLKSAHAVDREFRVMQALADSGVPVPRMYHLCENRDILGSLFFVMEFLPGRTFWDPVIPGCDNQQRGEIYDNMNQVLAALHSVDVNAAGLGDYGRPGNYFERQINRWSRQYESSKTVDLPAMDRLIRWLPENLPADDGQVSLIHGDYRIDNLMFAADGTEVLAVLDWELSTLGHPYADLAYQCMGWLLPHDAVIRGLGGVERESLGIPAEHEYVSRYCQRRGLSEIPYWPFYKVFSLFRFAAILQGIERRRLDGNASSDRAAEYGAMAPMLAAMGAELIN